MYYVYAVIKGIKLSFVEQKYAQFPLLCSDLFLIRQKLKFIDQLVPAWRRCVARTMELQAPPLTSAVAFHSIYLFMPLFVESALVCTCTDRQRSGPLPRVHWTQVQMEPTTENELPFISSSRFFNRDPYQQSALMRDF